VCETVGQQRSSELPTKFRTRAIQSLLDSGASFTRLREEPLEPGVNNRLAGMIHGALHRGPAHLHRQVHTVEHPAVTMSMNAVIGDLTNRNRPGSCFVPIVA
jgi:hypothetical protein